MNTIKEEKQKRIFICPSCNKRVTCKGQLGKKYRIKCPSCGKIGFVSFKIEERKSNQEENQENIQKHKRNPLINQLYMITQKNIQKHKRFFSINLPHNITLIVAIIILIVIGFLITFLSQGLKISFTLIFISSLLLLMISEKYKSQYNNETQLNIDKLPSKNFRESIPLIILVSLIIWTLILFIIFEEKDFWLLFNFVFLGILVTNELTSRYVTIRLQKRMNIITLLFLIGSILLIAQEIIAF